MVVMKAGTQPLQIAYRRNEAQHGIELIFDRKPDDLTRETIKSFGFRWHKVKKLWYAKETPDRLNYAMALANHNEAPQERPAATPAEVKTSETYKADKNALRAEYSKEWNDPKMIDYCTNKATHMVNLQDGGILPIEKRSIETRFCFGESGYDYDQASDMAHHAATDFDYFREENLKGFNDQIADITEQIESFTAGGYILTIGKHKQSNICYLHYERTTAILDAFGGSAYLADLPGQTVNIWNTTYRIPTAEELADILEAYKEARAKHAKRVETYLKKYGLSKVHTWTYWRDR